MSEARRRRLRVLVTPAGSVGDVLPVVAVAGELARRGHEVVMCTPQRDAEAAERVGITCRVHEAWAPPEEIAAGNQRWVSTRSPLGVVRRLRERWGPRIERLFRTTAPVARELRPDVVLGSSIGLHGVLLAEMTGAHWVSGLVSPAQVLSVADPPLVPGGLDVRGWPRPARSVYHALVRRIAAHAVDPVMNRLRREMRLCPRHDNLFGWSLSCGTALGLFSPELRGPAPDDPPGLRVCGFAWHDDGHTLDPSLERFLNDGEPPIVITLGTFYWRTMPGLLASGVEAARRAKRRVVVIGAQVDGVRSDARNALCVPYAPHSKLLGRGALTIHHAGSGTLAWAIRAGSPMIVTPLAFDQFDHAARVESLGLGSRRDGRRVTVEWLADRLNALIGDPTVESRVRTMGEIVAEEDGARTGAGEIERAMGLGPGRPAADGGEGPRS